MLEAGGQCMDLQSLRHCRSFVFTPSDGFRDPDRRHQILLQGGQRWIGTDLARRITAIIVAAGERQQGDRGKEDGRARPLR